MSHHTPSTNNTRGYLGRKLIAAGMGTADWQGFDSRTTSDLAGFERHGEKFGPYMVPQTAREEGVPPRERGRLNVALTRIEDDHTRLHGKGGHGRKWARRDWQPSADERKVHAGELLALGLSVNEVADLSLLSPRSVSRLEKRAEIPLSAHGRTPRATEAANPGGQGGRQGSVALVGFGGAR